MFFIFGWGRRTKKNFGPALPVVCPNCGNRTWFNYLTQRTWFTLFFIPVIPYESKKFLLCPVCSRGVQLKGDQGNTARQLSVLALQLKTGQITEDDFMLSARALGGLTPVRMSQAQPASGLPAAAEPPIEQRVQPALAPQVASAAAPQAASASAPQADWYSDPSGRHQLRYWDGAGWTAHVSNNGQASVDQPSVEPSAT
jgi:hypothetical protein